MTKALVGLLALALAACASDAPTKPPVQLPENCDRQFHVSQGFSPSEHAALTRATARWNAITTEQFCLTDGDSAEHSIRPLGYKSPKWYEISAQMGGLDFIGAHYSPEDVIYIVVGVLDEETSELTDMHEYGHAHGLWHTPAPAIMHASVGTAKDFTDIDMAECRRSGACPWPSGLEGVTLNAERRPSWLGVMRGP